MAEEGGVSADERTSPADFPADRPEIPAVFEIDYFSQARKALSERSPFDATEETSTSAAVTLPTGLASLLNRHGDNRRRQKKSHSGGGDKKKKKKSSSSRANEKSRGYNIWAETEEYFRDVTLSDIDTLFELSSSSKASSLASRECFRIPLLGNAQRFNVVSAGCCEDEKKPAPIDNVVISSEDEKKAGEEVNNELIENVAAAAAEGALPQDDEKDRDVSDSCVSLEWFLGCRNKVSLTSERPSKKRKLLGGDAGLEKVLMTSPCDGDQPFCHYCGRGDSGTGRDSSNRLIVCASCKVAVHRKCYGVEEDVDGAWVCSWCKRKGDDVDDSVNPCVLCPKKGGALKPVNNSSTVEGVGSAAQFVHLFCCLWTPEVYIDDLKKMEPVMNVGGIKETRRKLVCNVCKVKCGACVRCSHGMFYCLLVLCIFHFLGQFFLVLQSYKLILMPLIWLHATMF